MIDFLNFINEYNGAFMVIITTVYVVATILICRANQQSASASLKQLEEARKEFEEANRAFVTINLDNIRGGLAVLKIHNSGRRVATDVSVKISDEFITNLPDDLGKKCLNQLSNANFSLGIGQVKYVFVCANPTFKKAAEKELTISVSYKDGLKQYSELISIDMNQHLWELIYESPLEDIRKEIKGINDSHKYVKEYLQRIKNKEDSIWIKEHEEELKERFNLE